MAGAQLAIRSSASIAGKSKARLPGNANSGKDNRRSLDCARDDNPSVVVCRLRLETMPRRE
jgi:hypothetical protein